MRMQIMKTTELFYFQKLTASYVNLSIWFTSIDAYYASVNNSKGINCCPIIKIETLFSYVLSFTCDVGNIKLGILVLEENFSNNIFNICPGS